MSEFGYYSFSFQILRANGLPETNSQNHFELSSWEHRIANELIRDVRKAKMNANSPKPVEPNALEMIIV